MSRRFPTFASHDAVRCFQCGSRVHAAVDTGHPDGGGRYRQTCTRDGLHTYYDTAEPLRVTMDRLESMVEGSAGKRLTYKDLIQ